jgi:hypothetical protein
MGTSHAGGVDLDDNTQTSEAGVFFAATIPFVAVLVVGLVGIANINETINNIPMQVTEQSEFSPDQCVVFCDCFRVVYWLARVRRCYYQAACVGHNSDLNSHGCSQGDFECSVISRMKVVVASSNLFNCTHHWYWLSFKKPFMYPSWAS